MVIAEIMCFATPLAPDPQSLVAGRECYSKTSERIEGARPLRNFGLGKQDLNSVLQITSESEVIHYNEDHEITAATTSYLKSIRDVYGVSNKTSHFALNQSAFGAEVAATANVNQVRTLLRCIPRNAQVPAKSRSRFPEIRFFGQKSSAIPSLLICELPLAVKIYQYQKEVHQFYLNGVALRIMVLSQDLSLGEVIWKLLALCHFLAFQYVENAKHRLNTTNV